ncbi:hypothetical protein KSS87_004268, partial [Heliosperma pusillum]
MKEDSLCNANIGQGVTIETMGNEGRLIVHIRSYNAI